MSTAAASCVVRRVGPAEACWPELLALVRTAFAYMDGRVDPPSSIHRLTLDEMRAEARGRGVARALIESAAQEARRRGLAALELQTRVELAENHAAFARLGFVKVGESRHPGYDRPTSITMRRALAAS